MICAPSNTAADFIAERMAQIPSVKDKIIRFYPEKREDIFNLDIENLKPYHLLSKFLFETIFFGDDIKDKIMPLTLKQ